MYCPKCGTKNSDQNEFCTSCGNSLSNITTSINNPNDNLKAPGSNDSIFKQLETDNPTVVSSTLNIGLLIASFIIPLVGIVMGILYMRKDHPAEKKAGRNWLIVAAIGTALNLILLKK